MTTRDSKPVEHEHRPLWPAVLLDLLVGVVEAIILLIAATSTALGIPPDSAPRSRYDHVVTLYSSVTIPTVLIVLVFYAVRRRWIAVAIQIVITLIVLVSVLILHTTRLSSGFTGY